MNILEIENSFKEFSKNCDPEKNQHPRNFCLSYVSNISQLADCCSKSHELVLKSFLDCSEIGKEKVYDSLVSFKETIKTRTPHQDLVNAFQKLTSDLAHFAETLSQVPFFFFLFFFFFFFFFFFMFDCQKLHFNFNYNFRPQSNQWFQKN